MTTVAVTFPTDLTCHYWLQPQPSVSLTGSGVLLPSIIEGSQIAAATPSTITFALDPAFLWNVRLDFRGAEPVKFEGFAPAAGDLLTQLSAQGWQA
jgi:hypothetical protein